LIPVRDFQLSVQLIKVVSRGGGTAQTVAVSVKSIDLTPYLGDGGTVRTSKSVRDPTGGFTVSFGDQISKQFGDTLYALIEPMDLIEIRASRIPWAYAGGKLPLIMRGYVSRVRRARAMGSDGSPEQVVVIEGQDSGKLLQINQLLYQLAYIDGEPFLDQFKLQAALGLDPAAQIVGSFVTTLIDKVVNPKIAALQAISSNLVKPFVLDKITVVDGTVVPQVISAFEGAMSDLLALVADRPWNEMFVVDEEAGPSLVFRPVPFKDLTGALIMPGAADPGTFKIDPADVLSIDASRSDAGVANFFWVPPDGMSIDNAQAASMSLVGKVLDKDYANSTPVLYGIRRMEAHTALLPSSYSVTPATLPTDQRPQAAVDALSWALLRTKQIEAMNRDNALYEDVNMQVCGSETIQAGQYLSLAFGAVNMTAYAASISHSISPFGTWTTSIAAERGTGWINRDAMTNPGWQEGRPGVYEPPSGAITTTPLQATS
jgi:hypothetical protein